MVNFLLPSLTSNKDTNSLKISSKQAFYYIDMFLKHENSKACYMWTSKIIFYPKM